jgi:hypothetical protein
VNESGGAFAFYRAVNPKEEWQSDDLGHAECSSDARDDALGGML